MVCVILTKRSIIALAYIGMQHPNKIVMLPITLIIHVG
jgi:hypothetical protein